MGKGSSNSQAQTQESLSFLDQSVKSLDTGGASATVLSTTNTLGNVTLDLTQNGLAASDVGTILDKFIAVGSGALDAVQQSAAATADIAKSATATQTETGATINRLAMPVLVTLALIMIVPPLLMKGKRR